MKKRLFLILSVFVTLSFSAIAKEQINYQPYDLDKMLHEIDSATGPVMSDEYIIFTAEPKYRYVGIAFDFEDYQVVHPFQVFMSTDENGKKTAKHYFYTYKRTHKISELKYRMVIDGLWTVDPLNPVKEYDEDVNLYFSKVEAPGSIIRNTELTTKGTVHFIYKGQSGLKLNLAGNFTNWDPWIYQLKETAPGFYELELPLPPGKHYYNYYIGLTPVMDNTNPAKSYTKDGRTVSVIDVK